MRHEMLTQHALICIVVNAKKKGHGESAFRNVSVSYLLWFRMKKKQP